jgi:hypothetical protein
MRDWRRAKGVFAWTEGSPFATEGHEMSPLRTLRLRAVHQRKAFAGNTALQVVVELAEDVLRQ